MRIDSPISSNAQITGSFSGSFFGDGSGIAGVTAEWDGSHTGDASITGSLNVSTNVIVGGTVDGRDIAADGSKLDGIESGATADQTAAEIKTAYESNADTNEFSDAEKSKLAAIEAGATGDLTGAEIKALYEAEADTNAYDDAAVSKLAGIEANADVTDATNVEAAGALMDSEVTDLAGIKSVTISTLQPKLAEGAFVDGDKTKLDGIESGAEANTVDSVAGKTGTVTLVKGDVGLGNVDNTSDANKPISTATQAALDLKAPLASPALTGTPTAPTALTSNDSTQIATTAFVQDRIAEVIDTAPAALDTLNELAAAIGDDANFASTVTTGLSEKLAKASNLSDLTDAAAARTNLGVDAAGTVNYTHPTHPGDDINIDTGALTGATVISDLDFNVTTDTLGHVTDANATISTRNLTLADLGYTGATNANYITNNNQLTNGAGYITSYVDTTYSAGNGISLSGTTFTVGAGNGLSQTSTGLAMSGTYTGTFTATADIVAYSDERLKKDVSTIEGALDKTKQLRGVEFTRIEDGARSIGVIAQELEKVLPELVITNDEGIKGVNYAQITGLLIEAVKELSAKVDELSK